MDAEESMRMDNLVENIELSNFRRPSQFNLSGPYIDPFLKKTSLSIPTDSLKKLTLQKPVPKEKPIVFWPDIKYYGLVRNTDVKNPRAIISIDGTIYKVGIHEELYDGIQLKKITKESVEIIFQRERKVFMRK